MEKFKFAFLIDDNNHWDHVFGHLKNILNQPDKVDKITVVIISTAILNCLKNADVQPFKDSINLYISKGVEFFLCGNTTKHFNFTADDIISQISITPGGGLIKMAELMSDGYFQIKE